MKKYLNKVSLIMTIMMLLVLNVQLIAGASNAVEIKGSFPDEELVSAIQNFQPSGFSTMSENDMTATANIQFSNVSASDAPDSENIYQKMFFTTQTIDNATMVCMTENDSSCGLDKNSLSHIEVSFNVKLGNAENTNIYIGFGFAVNRNGAPTVSAGDWGRDNRRTEFADEAGNTRILINAEPTTEWQTVTQTLDFSGFTKMIKNGDVTDAVWENATALLIEYGKDSSSTETSICIGNVDLIFNNVGKCNIVMGFDKQKLTSYSQLSGNVKVDNALNVDKTFVAMLAVYKDDEMISLVPALIEADAACGEIDPVIIDSLNLPADVSDMEVVLYCWYDLESMQSIMPNLSITD